MSTEDQKARVAFEAWHIARQRRRGYGERLQDAEFVGRHANGKYSSLGLEDAWEAWKASRAALMSNAAPEVDRSGRHVEVVQADELDARYGFVTKVAWGLALEEAAKVCDEQADGWQFVRDSRAEHAADQCAAAIRALADPLQGKETP
jgi:hypothetical protein